LYRLMRILLLHNYYQQPGGEDIVFEAEKAMLESKGHQVITFVENNIRLNEMNLLKSAINTVWSRETKQKLIKLIKETRPDVAHFHNTFLLISPSAYYACKEIGVPVIQTLHNYRLICPGALLMRNGKVCDDCVRRTIPLLGVVYGCWRGSRAGTAVVATMLTFHRFLKTWQEKVDVYIALTEFMRQKFIEGGLPAEKIVVKPNFVAPDPDMGLHDGGYALFVGRLSQEKGVMTLLQTWQKLKNIPLKIVGDGPLYKWVEDFIIKKGLKNVELLGRKPRNEVFQLMQRAQVLVFPSEWYEGFPMTIAEAFACGLPVVASRLGAMAEIVEDGRTGLLFRPGDPEDLAAKVEWAWSHPKELREMGLEARKEYERKYTAEQNYQRLMEIYQKAIGRTERR